MNLAKWMVAVVAIYGFGGFLYDAIIPKTARMHLRNPHWPPHAKFHNGQTVLLGIGLGALSLMMLFGFGTLTLPTFLLASATAGLYFVTMALAPVFPGTAWVDPEFADVVPKRFGLSPQQFVTYVLLVVLGLAVTIALLTAQN